MGSTLVRTAMVDGSSTLRKSRLDKIHLSERVTAIQRSNVSLQTYPSTTQRRLDSQLAEPRQNRFEVGLRYGGLVQSRPMGACVWRSRELFFFFLSFPLPSSSRTPLTSCLLGGHGCHLRALQRGQSGRSRRGYHSNGPFSGRRTLRQRDERHCCQEQQCRGRLQFGESMALPARFARAAS